MVNASCNSEEHYVATLLAVYGLEEECECKAEITWTEWSE